MANDLINNKGGVVFAVLSGVGAVATAAVSFYYGMRAQKKIDESAKDLTKKDIAKIIIKEAMVPAGVTVCTIGSISGAAALNYKQQVSLVSAYETAKLTTKKLVDKVKDEYGADGLNKVVEKIVGAPTKIDNPVKKDGNEVIDVQEIKNRYKTDLDGEDAINGMSVDLNSFDSDEYDEIRLFYMPAIGYFERTPHEVNEAEEHLAEKFNQTGEATATDFAEYLKIDPESIKYRESDTDYENEWYGSIKGDNLIIDNSYAILDGSCVDAFANEEGADSGNIECIYIDIFNGSNCVY